MKKGTDMEIVKVNEGAKIALLVTGRIDAKTAAAFERETTQYCERAGEGLILDFAGVTYLSSAGLRAILGVHKFMARRGGMEIRHLNPQVSRICKQTGFDRLLKMA